MAFKQKKICVFFCGSPAGIQGNFPQERGEELIEALYEAGLLAFLSGKVVADKNGVDVTHEDWERLAVMITEAYDHYDGFIVFHHIDKLLTGACETGFMIGRVKKPIIFTTLPQPERGSLDYKDGEFILHNFMELDLQGSLLNGIQFINIGQTGFSLMFGNTIFPAMRAYESAGQIRQMYNSFEKEHWASIDVKMQTAEEKAAKKKIPFYAIDLKTSMETRVLALDAATLTQQDMVKHFVKEGIRGIMLTPEASGDFSSASTEVIKALIDEGIVICILQKMSHTKLDIDNLIYARGMGKEVALAKFMWVLGQTNDKVELQNLLDVNRSGEREGGKI